MVKLSRKDFVIFILAVIFAYVNNLLNFQTGYIETPDGTLYLSIAQNFVETGHFIQTARPHEIHMIVPPGVPFVFAIILGCFYHLFSIVVIQYILFGLTAVLTSKAGSFIYPIAEKLISCICPAMFVSAAIYLGQPNPGMLLTENWVCFMIVLAMFLFLHPELPDAKKICLLVFVLFALVMMRPAMSGLLCLAILFMLVFTLYKKTSWKCLLGCLFIMISVLGVNIFVNYRETGELVALENYSGSSMYLANNPNTKTIEYYSSISDQFADEFFAEVYNNDMLTSAEKNELLKDASTEFIKDNLFFVIRNAATRYFNYFIDGWNWNFYLFFIATLVFFLKKSFSLCQMIVLIASFLVVTVVPAFGLYVFRYSLPCIPYYVIINGALYGRIIHGILGRLYRSIQKEKI